MCFVSLAVGRRFVKYKIALHVHEASKAVKDPYSCIYLNYFEFMSGFAGFIVNS
jgi:hypothetical protein